MTDLYKCDTCEEYDKEKDVCPKFCEIIKSGMTDRIIVELWRIKIKIDEEAKNHYKEKGEDLFTDGLYFSASIIDEKIAELKEQTEKIK